MNNGGLAVTPEPKVHSSVRAASAHFFDLIAAMAIDLAYLLLEFPPGELVQPVDVQVLLEEGRSLLPEFPARDPGAKGHYRRDRTEDHAQQGSLWNLDAVLKPDDRHQEERAAASGMHHAGWTTLKSQRNASKRMSQTSVLRRRATFQLPVIAD